MIIDPKLRYAMFVESPEKCKTITKIFRDAGINNIFLFATIGHFDKIADGSGYYNSGIHPEDDFKIDFVVDSSKKEIVDKLKTQVKLADKVILASDPDREGEAIAWACVKFLHIPKNKYCRVTYQAINYEAIMKGIENASDINMDLVAAAHTRGALDKGFGFGISNKLREKKKGRSGGRVQSTALKIIVDREKEILNFKPEKYFDIYLHFTKNNVNFKAKYVGTDKKPVKRVNSDAEITLLFESCKAYPFVVKSIEKKERKDNPKVPFSTATFQQECENKLGLISDESSKCSQQLFDMGKISYHRTDSEQFEEEFASTLKKFVKNNFPKEYVSSKVVAGKPDPNAQEGHEALHVLDLNLTPEKYAKEAPNEILAKVYRIIYNRTVAAALNPAIISQTTYNIYNGENKFALNSNELAFDGYKRVYSYKDDSDEKDDIVKETFEKEEKLQKCSLESVPKETNPPSRYKEGAFVIKMKDEGIGRPSTYTSTIKTLKSETRGYCVVENKCLKPTELGMENIDFLDENFSDIVNINYTREMENSLDLITQGKLDNKEFLKLFFENLDSNLNKVSDNITVDKVCPQCGKPLVSRKSRFGLFLGCSGYPKCKYMETIKL